MGSMAEAYNKLKGYASVGAFYAYQRATDLNYSEITNFSEMEFTVPGPTALRGIDKGASQQTLSRSARTAGGAKEAAIQQGAGDNHANGQDPGRARGLHLIDVQNLFCEFDNWCRRAYADQAEFPPDA
jgi:hypothetical protein